MDEYSHCVGCNSEEKLEDLDYEGYCAACNLEWREMSQEARDKVMDWPFEL